MKKTLFVLNWKANPETHKEAKSLWTATKKSAKRSRKSGVVVCPPAVYLPILENTYDGNALIGAQDVSLFDSGAKTGEISVSMLKNLRVKCVIVGHSERRAIGETNETVAKKVKKILSAKLTPILCVGEHERGVHGEHFAFIEKQLKESLKGVPKTDGKNIIVAYEPLWAIGKSARYAMKPEEIQETMLFIKKVLTKIFNRKTGLGAIILYGGSVEPSNIASVVHEGEVSGVLVGHASLVESSVSAMLKELDKN